MLRDTLTELNVGGGVEIVQKVWRIDHLFMGTHVDADSV